jgi:hypothetical protein
MAFNFTPLEYNPFEYSNTQAKPYYDQYEGHWVVPRSPDPRLMSGPIRDWERRSMQRQMDQQQDYSGDQFQSLFDSVNDLGASPMVSGSAYDNTPQYSPYQGTREQFTTQNDVGDSPSFNQQGYLDARFNNINDYLGRMGSFFGNMGSQDGQTQALLANMQGQGPRPVMPSVGMPSVGMGGGFNPSAGGTGGTSGNNPFQSFGALPSGGWGTAPTSLFGGGSGLNPNTSPSIPTPSSYPTPQRATMRASTEGNQNSAFNNLMGAMFGGTFTSS